jgi:hypothetical protein
MNIFNFRIKNIFGQKSIFLSHNGERNLVKKNHVLFSVTMGQSLYNKRQKSIEKHQFLVKLIKNWHYGPKSQKKLYRFFLIHVF